MNIKRNKKKAERLNLIPILDAIFIFIFFLLMSAQFVDIYEIGTNAPITSTETSEMKKEPLNLTLILKKDQIQITTGLSNKLHKKFNYDQLALLNEELILLKQKNNSETTAIISPIASIAYEQIVQVIDATKAITKKDKVIEIKNSKGKMIKTNQLFTQVVFETK